MRRKIRPIFTLAALLICIIVAPANNSYGSFRIKKRMHAVGMTGKSTVTNDYPFFAGTESDTTKHKAITPKGKKRAYDEDLSTSILSSILGAGSHAMLGLALLFGNAGVGSLMLMCLGGAPCLAITAVVTGIMALFRRSRNKGLAILGIVLGLAFFMWYVILY